MTKEELGPWGEEKATSYLLKKGFVLVDRNIRFKRYEVDIVMENNNLLVIIEVKTRNTAEIGEPWRAVTKRKQVQIIQVANQYVQKNQIDKDVRFDVISIVHNSSKTNIEHFEGAFTP
jgi:putative endonuclease